MKKTKSLFKTTYRIKQGDVFNDKWFEVYEVTKAKDCHGEAFIAEFAFRKDAALFVKARKAR